MENKKARQEVKKINIQSLKDLAIYLAGLKDGKGNLLSLGTIVLDDLWDTIDYLEGDVRYEAKRDSFSFDEREPEIGAYISLVWEDGSDCECTYRGLDKLILPLPTHWYYVGKNSL